MTGVIRGMPEISGYETDGHVLSIDCAPPAPDINVYKWDNTAKL